MPSEDAATWERYEALRDAFGVAAHAMGQAEPGGLVVAFDAQKAAVADLDAFVRGLLERTRSSAE